MTANTQIKDLAKLLESNWITLDRNPVNMLVDDCLASLGFPLDYEQTPKQRAVLFEAGQMYGDYVSRHPYDDVLGGLYESFTSKGHAKALGQFFTPSHVNDLISQLVMDIDPAKVIEDGKQGKLLRWNEPCIGVGGMVLASARLLNDAGALQYTSITGIDLDRHAARACLLQFAAPGLYGHPRPAEFAVFHGNALGDLNDAICIGGWNDIASNEKTNHTADAEDNEEDPECSQPMAMGA